MRTGPGLPLAVLGAQGSYMWTQDAGRTEAAKAIIQG